MKWLESNQNRIKLIRNHLSHLNRMKRQKKSVTIKIIRHTYFQREKEHETCLKLLLLFFFCRIGGICVLTFTN